MMRFQSASDRGVVLDDADRKRQMGIGVLCGFEVQSSYMVMTRKPLILCPIYFTSRRTRASLSIWVARN